jgi:hypothetical protein
MAMALMQDDIEAVIGKLVEMAKAGNITAIKIVVDRLVPVPRDSTVMFDAPKLKTSSDLRKALSGVLQAVAAGTLTPAEGQAVAQVCSALSLTHTLEELEQALDAMGERG